MPRPERLAAPGITALKAVLDACVLAGSIRRHMLLSFAEAGLFEPVWSQPILDETRRAVPKTLSGSLLPPEARVGHADEVCRLLNASFPGALQSCPKGPDIPGLPDPDDAHVIRLAHGTRCDLIVTENLKDFPPEILSGLDLVRSSCDSFLSALTELEPAAASHALERLRFRIGLEEVNRQSMLLTLRRVGLKRTARLLNS